MDKEDGETGLSYGPRPRGGLCMLGALQSAGGSINWLNGLLFGEEGFDRMLEEAAQIPPEPTELIYLPYLTGSGPPRMNRGAKGAFIGLGPNTSRLELLSAVYQGLAFESRVILEAAGLSDSHMMASGGLSVHSVYMQLLADCLCLQVNVPQCQEGTLYGAARLMAWRAGADFPVPDMERTYLPDEARSHALLKRYTDWYLPLRRDHLNFYEAST